MKRFPHKNIFLQLFSLGLFIYTSVAFVIMIKKLVLDDKNMLSQCNSFICAGEWTAQTYFIAGVSSLIIAFFLSRWLTSVQRRKIDTFIQWSKAQKWQFKKYEAPSDNTSDHEHCLLCNQKIEADENPKIEEAYFHEEQSWMCQKCYECHINT